jgi:hypothetical protein
VAKLFWGFNVAAVSTTAMVLGGALLANQVHTANRAKRAAADESDKQYKAEQKRVGEITEQKKKKEYATKQATLRSQQVAKAAASEGRASTILGGAAAPVSMPQPGSAAGGLKTILGN